MNFKQLGAIALTLIVACPIAIGYMLSLEDEDVDGWTVSESVNVSDLMLNATKDSYMKYTGVSNNNNIDGSLPAYVEVSNTYSPYPVSRSTYANVTAGWYITTLSTWDNGLTNNAITMVISALNLNKCQFTIYDTDNGNILGADIFELFNGDTWYLKYSNASYPIGDYDYYLLVLDNSVLTVSGLDSWPTASGTYKTYNSVSCELNGSVENFTEIQFNPSSGSVIMRVEYTNSLASSYPITDNYTLDMNALYPGDSWNIKLNSIGLYGDSFQFAGSSYILNNNKILVDGSWINLRGIILSSRLEDSGNYVNSINGHEVGETSAPATVYFGGEWSLTATAEILEQTTGTKLTWHAGGFGLDREGFVAAGLLVCVAAFVVLGASGRMSGPKAAFLALICGGGALIYLMIL